LAAIPDAVAVEVFDPALAHAVRQILGRHHHLRPARRDLRVQRVDVGDEHRQPRAGGALIGREKDVVPVA
jgi:hypothetical protein